jgi:putative membrane protein
MNTPPMEAVTSARMRRAWIWLAIYFSVLSWSAIHPRDVFTWWLEVTPALLALGVLALTYRRFRLTRLTYLLILGHCIILMVGGHYTYAEVPLFDWLRQLFALQRNDYDKLGHFAQGFVPAIVAREILLRKAIVRGRGWLFYIVVSACLAISAFYELIEWWVAIFSGTSSEAFLGTQGDVWDTQSDMAFALMGAILAQVLLGRVHDRQLAELTGGKD